MNMMLMEMDRNMLNGFDAFFGRAQVVSMNCYLVNISPTITLIEKTPMEVWSRKNPSL